MILSFPTSPDDACRLRLKNINNLLALEACDAGLSPTAFQRSLHPAEFRHKITVIHDGIDTDALIPNPAVTLTLNNSTSLTRQDEVITFANRNLEPYRGWHTFARALPQLLARRPKAHILIVGGDDVSYGSRPTDGVSYKQRYLTEVIDRLDMQRVHFLGRIPYAKFLAVLQLSSAHIYLTYPFVLSWSMLQAMNTGHDGSLSTVHANSPRDAVARLETLAAMSGLSLPHEVIRKQISSAIDIIIQVARLGDGGRKLVSLQEITGMEGNVVTTQEFFRFEQTSVTADGSVKGRFMPGGFMPRFTARFYALGIKMPKLIFDPRGVVEI